MHPVDIALINLRSALQHADVANLWKRPDWRASILASVQRQDPNGDWLSESAVADLAGMDGLDYVIQTVTDWCTDAGV